MRCKESTPSLQRHEAQGDDQDKYEDVVTANGQHGSASIPQLALLWQIWLKAACEQHLTVRAS